jgi:hypothetical protein
VPLYALIQTRAERSRVARIVAANNILNALFMVAASLIATGLVLAFGTLSAQNSAIEMKLERKLETIEANTVPRTELAQIEKRLEAIHADIREIRNNSR